MRLAAFLALPLVLSLSGCQSCVESSAGENETPPSSNPAARPEGGLRFQPRLIQPGMRINVGDGGAAPPTGAAE
jgi:hypothetical protein